MKIFLYLSHIWRGFGAKKRKNFQHFDRYCHTSLGWGCRGRRDRTLGPGFEQVALVQRFSSSSVASSSRIPSRKSGEIIDFRRELGHTQPSPLSFYPWCPDGAGGGNFEWRFLLATEQGFFKRRPRPAKDMIFDHKDVEMLSQFTTPGGKIVAARVSRLNAKQQRQLATAVKRARQLALLPNGAF